MTRLDRYVFFLHTTVGQPLVNRCVYNRRVCNRCAYQNSDARPVSQQYQCNALYQ
jgi:hypothetical protein